MQGNEMANFEACLNIWVNLTQIIAVLYGAGLFWSAVVLGIMQKFRPAGQCLGGALGLLIYTVSLFLLMPVMLAAFAPIPGVGMTFCIVSAVVTGLGGLCLFCLPMFILQRRGIATIDVNVWNWCSILFPPLWIVAMVKASSRASTLLAHNATISDGIPPGQQ
jgi:hypothetical protein